MGYPRYLQVPPQTRGTYHCVSRCVRRAFLCGEDALTGRSFDHRKQWLEERIVELAKIFAVAVHAYAVMSNHFHLVVETEPLAPSQWSDEEVATRWLLLSGSRNDKDLPLEKRIAVLAAQPERLVVLRQRLGSLSWYMRCLKEPIARRANREDDCTGRFWEGRFRTQALLDDPALLASMVYVDLNPMRAGIANSIEGSMHTSARVRAQYPQQLRKLAMMPIAASIRSQCFAVTAEQYLELVNWTARALHPVARDIVAGPVPSIIKHLGLRSQQWCLQVPATESHYARAIGQLEALVERARIFGVKWIRGIGMARRLQHMADTS